MDLPWDRDGPAFTKNWLGFKIARSNGDRNRMRHYASFISKVQERWVLKLPNLTLVSSMNKKGMKGLPNVHQGRMKQRGKMRRDNERSPDYDDMIKDAHDKG